MKMMSIKITANTVSTILTVFGCISIIGGILLEIPLLALTGFILILSAILNQFTILHVGNKSLLNEDQRLRKMDEKDSPSINSKKSLTSSIDRSLSTYKD